MTKNDIANKAEWADYGNGKQRVEISNMEDAWAEERDDAMRSTQMLGGVLLLLLVIAGGGIVALAINFAVKSEDVMAWAYMHVPHTIGLAFAGVGIAWALAALFGKGGLASRCGYAVLGVLLVALGGNIFFSALYGAW